MLHVRVITMEAPRYPPSPSHCQFHSPRDEPRITGGAFIIRTLARQVQLPWMMKILHYPWLHVRLEARETS